MSLDPRLNQIPKLHFLPPIDKKPFILRHLGCMDSSFWIYQ